MPSTPSASSHERVRTSIDGRVSVLLGVGLIAAMVVALMDPAHGATPSDPSQCVAALPLAWRVGQTILPIVSEPDTMVAPLRESRVAGFAIVGRLDAARAQAFKDAAAAPAPLGVLMASDEEGGTVQRYRRVLGALPAARDWVDRAEDPASVEAEFVRYGAALREQGVNLVFAPVVDVGFGPAIGSRAFSDDPAVVSTYAAAVARGYRAAGITPVLKHFPNHGRASADTHDSPAVTPAFEGAAQPDLLPYRTILAAEDATSPAVMIGHLEVPGLTEPGEPASQSQRAITWLLREQLQFDGLVISDALGMGAITASTTVPAAAVHFLAAGGDLAIVDDAASVEPVHAAITAAIADPSSGYNSAQLNQSVLRVLRTKAVDPCAVAEQLGLLRPEASAEPAQTATPPPTIPLPSELDVESTARTPAQPDTAQTTESRSDATEATAGPTEQGRESTRATMGVALIAGAVALMVTFVVVTVTRRRHEADV